MDSDILLVDDNAGLIQTMGRILSGLGPLRFSSSGEAALKQARDVPPDLVLLNAEMSGMSGFQVCEAMKADPTLRDIPVIFVTGHSGPEFESLAIGSGAVDFIVKPISEPLLMARVKTQLRVKRLTDELRRISTTDALTEVPNRRHFDDSLALESVAGRCGSLQAVQRSLWAPYRRCLPALRGAGAEWRRHAPRRCRGAIWR